MEDFLVAQFKRSAVVSEYSMHGCNFPVSFDAMDQRVLSDGFISNGACIGQLFGDSAYIWDIGHSEYLFIDEDRVLDVSNICPRQTLSFMRDDNQSNHPCNCEILVMHDGTSKMSFLVFATRVVYPREELVYAIEHYR